MDSSKSIIPFWEEDQTSVLDLSTGEIYDILDRFSSTVFATNRAWWNSNIPMENWMPQFMPVVECEEVNDLFKLFAVRFVQRNTTHDLPLRKGVPLSQGLAVYKDGVIQGTFVRSPDDDEVKFFYIQSPAGCLEDDPHIHPAKIDNATIVRQVGYKYFNGERYV